MGQVVRAEIERRDDAEVAAATALAGPVKVAVRVAGVAGEDAPVGGHDLYLLDRVGGEPERAGEHPDAAAERQAGDADRGAGAAGYRLPVRVQAVVEVDQVDARAAADAVAAVVAEPADLGYVDDEPVMDAGPAFVAVPARPGPHRQFERAGEVDALGDVGRLFAVRHPGRIDVVEERVIEQLRGAVAALPGPQQLVGRQAAAQRVPVRGRRPRGRRAEPDGPRLRGARRAGKAIRDGGRADDAGREQYAAS